MEQLNKVHIRGTVGAVNTHRINENFISTRFSVATSFAYRNQNGESVMETTWHSVFAWEEVKVKKGDCVEVVGRIRIQRYTDVEGNDRTFTEILASEIKVLDAESLTYEM